MVSSAVKGNHAIEWSLEALKPDSTRTLNFQFDTSQMVNFLHNITALAGAATVCKIFDFKNSILTIAGGLGEDEIAVLGAPVVAGAANQSWMIIPQVTANTFTLQSVAQLAVFVSYAAAASKVPGHSQAVVRMLFPPFSKWWLWLAGQRPSTATNTALTTWANADPATFTFQGTPVRWVAFHPVYTC
ncbi:hypothetical protein B0H13DRAFT_1919300 [Mycena leptocephala]|nr:hypothetical protein B0H13DRAFT_1919300 [Mycena leptocephala]